MLMFCILTLCRGVGKLHVQKQSKVGEIVPQLLEKKGLPSSTAVKLFEVCLISFALLLTLSWDDTKTRRLLIRHRKSNQQ